MSAPEGFAPHFRQSPVTNPWEPLFSRREGDMVQLGLTIAEAHCNSRGFLHGGVIAALADNAMGLSYVAAAGSSGAVTVGLQVDYAGTGRIGQWLHIAPRLIKAGKSMGFVDALISADAVVIARASATFRIAS